MTLDGTNYICFLLSQAGIAANLLEYLPAGELISLSRTNSQIRADLHDFDEPHPWARSTLDNVRPALQIGHHETPRWKKLKANSAFQCSSPTHTRGTDVKPCRYCSKLICGACMTRASFKNPGEKTFQMRCKSFCGSCWTQGNRHKKQKITDDCECHAEGGKGKSKEFQDISTESVTCECTNRKDGWVCLECKHLQNVVWKSNICFGEGCTNALDMASERQKICMWCDKPLPITATRDSPHVYKQKLVDAIAREAAIRVSEAETYALRRQKRLKMSRSELRGGGKDQPDNTPEFVRDLDTVNYAYILGPSNSPTQQQIYASKNGRWQYSQKFLFAFQPFCRYIQLAPDITVRTQSEEKLDARSNLTLLEVRCLQTFQQNCELYQATSESESLRTRIDELRYKRRYSIHRIREIVRQETGDLFSYNAYAALFWKWTFEDEKLKATTRSSRDVALRSVQCLQQLANRQGVLNQASRSSIDTKSVDVDMDQDKKSADTSKKSFDSAYHSGLDESSSIKIPRLTLKSVDKSTDSTQRSPNLSNSQDPTTRELFPMPNPQNEPSPLPRNSQEISDLEINLAPSGSLRQDWHQQQQTIASDVPESGTKSTNADSDPGADMDMTMPSGDGNEYIHDNETGNNNDVEMDADLQLAIELSLQAQGEEEENAELSSRHGEETQERNVSRPDGRPPEYFA